MASHELVLARSSADALQAVLKSIPTTSPNDIVTSEGFYSLGPMMQRMVVGQIMKAIPGSLSSVDGRGSGGWWPIIREPFAGAWQQNEEESIETVVAFSAVFSCVTLIASDIGKMRLKLVTQDSDGIWDEIENAAFSPVLRKPNRYQNRIQFVTWWMTSKLLHGNTYGLKALDQRGVVVGIYILDPTRVTPLVAPDGSVYYSLKTDNISGLRDDVIVPASAIIHDVGYPLFHPLVGVSPIYACGLAAVQGLRIQNNSSKFFGQDSRPGGVLTAPGAISQPTADRVKEKWETGFSGDNYGKVAVLGDGLKYEAMSVNADDAQLIEQLKWTAENVCTAFRVPPYKIGVGPPPAYNNIEALDQQYYSQCLQIHIESLELVMDEGLGLAPNKIDGRRLGVEFELDDLLRMDTATLIKSEKDAVGIKQLNESRRRLNLKPIPGGDTVYLQQQYYSVDALNRRDQMAPAPPSPSQQIEPPKPDPDEDATEKYISAFVMKAVEEGLHAA